MNVIALAGAGGVAGTCIYVLELPCCISITSTDCTTGKTILLMRQLLLIDEMRQRRQHRRQWQRLNLL